MQGHKSDTSDSPLLQGISSASMPTRPSKSGGTSNASKRDSPKFSLSTSIHAAESDFISPNATARHDFKVTLEPSTYSEEKYTLYLLYQRQIHHDPHNTPEDFKRFLVKSPLINEPIPYPASAPDHLPSQYGSFHQMYRLDACISYTIRSTTNIPLGSSVHCERPHWLEKCMMQVLLPCHHLPWDFTFTPAQK
jgi:arginine-tRNA-protein transferase